ncbi:MAG: AAA family ATPase [Firmicutes bacterium]|nr:AAA family ATPase [Bacillota bacterium]
MGYKNNKDLKNESETKQIDKVDSKSGFFAFAFFGVLALTGFVVSVILGFVLWSVFGMLVLLGLAGALFLALAAVYLLNKRQNRKQVYDRIKQEIEEDLDRFKKRLDELEGAECAEDCEDDCYACSEDFDFDEDFDEDEDFFDRVTAFEGEAAPDGELTNPTFYNRPNRDYITLKSEDDKDVRFKIVAEIKVGDIDYVVVYPHSFIKGVKQKEMMMYRVIANAENSSLPSYILIEDEAIHEQVFQEFLKQQREIMARERTDITKIKTLKSKPEETTIPTVSLDDIAGLDDAKKALEEKAILPMQHRELFKKYEKNRGGGILLFGLPGTGKTMFAQAVATELDAKFFPIKCSDIESKWVGESEKNIRRLFENARRYDKSVIFFDEFDTIGKKRSEKKYDNTVQEILANMQGVENYENQPLVLAATNAPWLLDSALLRPGRFSDKIYIPLPDKKARLFMLNKHLKSVKLDTQIKLDKLADQLDGYSGADIVEICEKVKMLAIRKEIARVNSEQRSANSEQGSDKSGKRVDKGSGVKVGKGSDKKASKAAKKLDESKNIQPPIISKKELNEIVAEVKPSTIPSDFDAMQNYAKNFAKRQTMGF